MISKYGLEVTANVYCAFLTHAPLARHYNWPVGFANPDNNKGDAVDDLLSKLQQFHKELKRENLRITWIS